MRTRRERIRKQKRRTLCEERRKGRVGEDDALKDRRLVSLIELVDRLEELFQPWLTLSSQKWPTLSRRANIVKGVVDRPQPTLFLSPC